MTWYQLLYQMITRVGRLALSGFSDKAFSKIQFFIRQGYFPNLEAPQSFNEKIQWLKLNYRDPLIQKCANKLLVREYVKDCCGPEILIPLVGCFKRSKEIKFEALPQRFVCKASHGSGWNIVAFDKNKLNWPRELKKLEKWMSIDFYVIGREWAYKDSPREILIEHFIDGPNGQPPYDFKIFCFNGNPKFVQVDTDRFSGHRRSFYNLKWEQLPFGLEYPLENRQVSRPVELDKMIAIAETLSRPFPFVRCDLYNSKDKVYFGELTFYPGKGVEKFRPRDVDIDIGMMLKLNDWHNKTV